MEKYFAQMEMLDASRTDQEMFSVSGTFLAGGDVSVMRIAVAIGLCRPDPPTEHDLLLLDESGTEIACNGLNRSIVRIVPPMDPDWEPGQSVGGYSMETADFHSSIPRLVRGVTLAIEKNGVRLWTCHAPVEHPTVTDLTVVIGDDVGQLFWHDNIAANYPQNWVRAEYRHADGTSGSIGRKPTTEHPCYFNEQLLPRGVFEFDLIQVKSGEVVITLTVAMGFS